MQTIKSLKSEIDSLRKSNSNPRLSEDSEYKKAQKRIQFLYTCLLYLEGNPAEKFINKQLDDLNKKLTRIENGFKDWRS